MANSENTGKGKGAVTQLLDDAGSDNRAIIDRLLPLVYDELRAMAHRQRARFRSPVNPGTTSVVHEAYLKLVQNESIEWESRGQFYYLAAQVMRSILVDNARRWQALKRGGDQTRVSADDVPLMSEQRGTELLALDEALERLAHKDQRLASVVVCRFYGGLSVAEAAEATETSPATVKRDWSLARAWLFRELKQPLAENALAAEDPPGEAER